MIPAFQRCTWPLAIDLVQLALVLTHGLCSAHHVSSAILCRAKAQDDWTKDLPLPSFMKGHGKQAAKDNSVVLATKEHSGESSQ